jgi:hypothetical protein
LKRYVELVAISATTSAAAAAAAATATVSATTAAVASTAAAVSAAAAAAAAEATATTAASITAAGFLRTCFVDGQGPSTDVLTIKRRYRGFSLAIGAHLYKSKSLRSSCIPVRNNPSGCYSSVLSEKLLEIAILYVVGKISYV